MKKCTSCNKLIAENDKFCQHCGAGQTQKPPSKKAKEKKTVVAQNFGLAAIFKSVLIAAVVGIVFGYVRYWIGYFILIQGVIAGVLLTYFVKAAAKNKLQALADNRFKVAVMLFVIFLMAQAVGYGLAQPVFDPFNWFARVWNADTNESIFGIASTAGVVSQTFSGGLSGGFWLLLSGIDLFFMFFFILVSMPLNGKK